jgi:hypothetical protein
MKPKFYLLLFVSALSLNLSSQNFTTMTMETWENSNWKKSVRQTNTTDSKGNILTNATDSWNSTSGVWDKTALTAYTLNANSTVASTLTQLWNVNKWEDSQSAIYTYDASGFNLLTLKTRMYLGTGWLDYTLSTNTYDGSNQRTLSTNQTLDMMSMQMKNSWQMTFTYNADGTENQTVYKMWNGVTSVWDMQSRTTNTYNASKKVITELSEDYKSGNWVNDTKSVFTYNTDNTIKEVVSQAWDTTGSVWKDDSKEIFTYQNGNNTQILTQEWKGTAWVNVSRVTYTYPVTSAVQLQTPGDDYLTVFPNPSTGLITIKGYAAGNSDISIYNLEGQLVKTILKGSGLSGINLNFLHNGVYMVKAGNPGAELVTRFILQK